MSSNVGSSDGFVLAATLIASGQTAREVAEVCGVSQRTIERWKGRPAFRQLTDRLRGELLTASVGKLLDAAGDAVATLRRNLTCGNASAEIAAARGILSTALRGVEQSDLLSKFEELQGLVAEILKHESVKSGVKDGRGASSDSGAQAADDSVPPAKWRDGP